MRFLIKKNNYEKTSIFLVIFSIVIITIPITRQYSGFIPGITFAELLLLITSPVILLMKKKIVLNSTSRYLLVLWILSLFSTFISLFLQNYFDFIIVSRILRTSFYIFIIAFTLQYFDLTTVKKIYKSIIVLLILYLFLQTIMFYAFNIYLPYNILPLPLYSGDQLGIISDYDVLIFRPSSLFSEPGYFALFMIPPMILSLFNWQNQNKVDIKFFVLIFVSIIISGSTQGIVLSVFLSVFIILYKNKKNFLKLFFLFTMLLVFTYIIFFALNTDIIQYTINKLSLQNVRPGSSTALRIFRGWSIIAEMPLLQLITGVGHGNLGNYVLTNSISTRYDPIIMTINVAEYVNGITMVILYYGVFLGFGYFTYLYKAMKYVTLMQKFIMIFIIISTFAGGSLLNLSFIYFIAFIVGRVN